MFRRLYLLTTFSLLCTVGFSQSTYNTNNGVIINSTVVVTEPIYVPSPPPSSGSSDLDRRFKEIERKQQMQEIDRQIRVRAMSYKEDDFLLSPSEFDDRRYKDLPTYVTTQAVNMRTDGGTENPIIRQLPKGTVVKVVRGGSIFTSGWWQIHVPGTEGIGYVHPKYLKPRL